MPAGLPSFNGLTNSIIKELSIEKSVIEHSTRSSENSGGMRSIRSFSNIYANRGTATFPTTKIS